MLLYRDRFFFFNFFSRFSIDKDFRLYFTNTRRLGTRFTNSFVNLGRFFFFFGFWLFIDHYRFFFFWFGFRFRFFFSLFLRDRFLIFHRFFDLLSLHKFLIFLLNLPIFNSNIFSSVILPLDNSNFFWFFLSLH